MVHHTPDTREEAASKLPALHVLMVMGWTYLPPSDALAMRGSERLVLLEPVPLVDWSDIGTNLFHVTAEDGGYFDEFATRPIASLSYGKAWVNNHAHILRAGTDVQTEWLYFALVNKNILGFINSGTRSKLNKGDMLKIPLALPSLAEQMRISEVIGLADRDVIDLVQQIAKLHTEKKALMQQLLTGKRRVVV